MIRIEDFQSEGLLPILEAFPSYKSAISFVMAFRPSFVKSSQNLALQNHFTEHITEYYQNGMKSYDYWLLDDQYHRYDGPALIHYWANTGNVFFERWYIEGSSIKINGPVLKVYFMDGSLNYQNDKSQK